MYLSVRGALGLPTDDPIPKPPMSSTAEPLSNTQSSQPQPPLPKKSTSKRKVAEPDADAEMSTAESKRSKNEETKTPHKDTRTTAGDPALEHARAAASYIPFLDVDSLLPPKLPTREEMETVLLDLRKKALVEEYFGDEKS
jgi:pre-mRNA-splicing factor ISY1